LKEIGCRFRQLGRRIKTSTVEGVYVNCVNDPLVFRGTELSFSLTIICVNVHSVMTREVGMGSRMKRMGIMCQRGKVVAISLDGDRRQAGGVMS